MSISNASLLYIEDDQEIGTFINGELSSRGYEVTWLTSGDRALEEAETSNLVILDVIVITSYSIHYTKLYDNVMRVR